MTEIILTSSALILFLILTRKLLQGRIHPTLQYALWLLVAARLLIPGTLFTTPISLMGAAQELQTTIEEEYLPSDRHLFTDVSTPPVQTSPPLQISDPGDTPIPSVPSPAPPVMREPINWLAVIWKLGMVLTGGSLLLCNLVFEHRLRKKRELLSPAKLPRQYRTAVYLVADLTTPCLFGLLRPSIYINPESLSPQHLEHILTHEETHLRHRDHIWAILRSVCLTIHWYNPLVWWAALLSRRDCELSCDASAIHKLGETQRLEYGHTLLHMLPSGRHPSNLLHTATTMTASKRTMKERISLIARKPKMLKITMAALLAAVLAATVLTFGGAANTPEQDSTSNDTHTGTLPGISSGADTQAVSLTQEQAIAIYQEARTIWDWFALGRIPTTDAALDLDGKTFLTVNGFTSLADLRKHLLEYFSPALTEHLLTSYTSFHEDNGVLYIQSNRRDTNMYAGKEHVGAFLLTGKEAAQQGYDCHIHAATEVLDAYDGETVLYEKSHHWFMVWNGQNYVFTSFGPYDDVDPQQYYNALTILEHYKDGAGLITWWPMVAYLDWNAVQATQDQWPEGFDLAMYILTSLSEYVAGESTLTAAQMLHILSATEGLDGAYAEQFQFIVYELYRKAPGVFAYAVLDGGLPATEQAQILDYFRYEEPHHRAPSSQSAVLTREEAAALLQKSLSNSLSASPSEMTFTQPGQSALFVPVSTYGVYAASYVTSDPSVATVDDMGFVTAVGPGQAIVTLHYEGAGGQKDFLCTVTCDWGQNSVISYTHPSGFFSLKLPGENCRITETSTGITITLDGESWALRLLTQPSQWLTDYPTQALTLGTFDTNGTPQTYLLETADTSSPLTQMIADSFQLHVTAERISYLVHESFESDPALAIQYLPYLSWMHYWEQYGATQTGGLEDLLQALLDTVSSSPLSWTQYHDLLSALPDDAIDGTCATLYRSILQTLHDKNPAQFASVLLSQFISPLEKENALSWLDMDESTLTAEAP